MTDYRCIFLLLMLAGLPASHADAAAAEKPNFIIYMSDDIGYDPFGCAGNEYAKTPHRDLSSSVPEKLKAAPYNLKDDIAEAKNLAESHGKKTQSMSDLLENWGLETSRTAAPFPILKKPGQEAKTKPEMRADIVISFFLLRWPGAVVHGFASRRHPVLHPPTLVIRTDYELR